MKGENTNWLLLAPPHEQASMHFGAVQIDTECYVSLHCKVQEFRKQIYLEETSQKENLAYSEMDSHAWHLISQCKYRKEISGCVRILFFEGHQASPFAENILKFGEVEFSKHTFKKTCLRRIQQYLDYIKKQNKSFFYVGGLAVNKNARKLGHGALLGLGANAFTRILGHAEGMTFARSEKGEARLFQKLGAYPLDESITPFYCRHHRSYVQLLALSPYNNLPSATEKIVKRFEEYLKIRPVITRQ